MDDTSLRGRLSHAWNAFKEAAQPTYNYGISYGTRPDRLRFQYGNERSIITSVYNRIGIDVAAIRILHVRLDENGRFIETIDSGINQCLTVEANLDQSGRAFIQDVAMSMFDEGVVAIVPVDTTLNPNISGSYDVTNMRTGKILEWYPKHVRVQVYNERTGQKQDVIVDKKFTAIIENPLYAVMNEPNSTLKRLVNKLNLLDAIDTQSGSGKLDLIIQLPYVIKSAARQLQAEARRQAIEDQLSGSKYGIAYTDGTEKVTQLNRPTENNLMGQIEYLTSMLYSQLGLTEAIFDGTADEAAMLNYYNRTVEPVLAAITGGMGRTFLTKTARSQKQAIGYFRDPFSLVSVVNIAEIADKFTRNEIFSSNDIRGILGFQPSKDPKADELRNKNINQPDSQSSENLIPEVPDNKAKGE